MDCCAYSTDGFEYLKQVRRIRSVMIAIRDDPRGAPSQWKLARYS